MDLSGMKKKLLSGEPIERIGSSRVAPDADREGLAVAIENAELALQFARMAEHALGRGDPESAIYTYCQSIVFEESINNIWGICSDLGNVAEIYRLMGVYDKAEEIYVWLRMKDTELQVEPPEGTGLRPIAVPERQIKDYFMLHALHTEGLARVYIATGRKSSAIALMDEMINSYTKAEKKDALDRGLGLWRWLETHLD
jgi:hypothetical protein